MAGLGRFHGFAGAIGAMCVAGCLGAASNAAAVDTVTFIPGTYDLAETYLGAPVDTLVVTVSGGVADFTLSGADNATFSVPNDTAPDSFVFGDDPVYSTSIISESWDTTTYPFLTFWTNGGDGGVTVGSIPGDEGTNLFNTFQSTEGSGQVFTATPEPASWALLIAGFAGMGAAVRRSRAGKPARVA